jgi:integrase
VIRRENYFLVKQYLAYRQDVEQISISSARLEESWLRHVLEWAQERPFSDAPKIRPAFPAYILRARRDGDTEQLSRVYIDKVVRAARRFFEWLRIHEPGHGALTPAFADTLKTPRMAEMPEEHEIVTLDEIRAMAQAEVRGLREERIRAAAVFLFLSGMRIGAFITLPLKAVDIAAGEVKQWPRLGVRTKGGKHATTYLLPIHDLLDMVGAWDAFLRGRLPPSGLWFAPLSPTSGELDASADNRGVGRHRHAILRRDLQCWLSRVGLPYHSPHKFRHGHAVYSLKQADNVGDLKAISQNLMHSNLAVTDGVYAILSDEAVRERIEKLGHGEVDGLVNGEVAALLRALADRLERLENDDK